MFLYRYLIIVLLVADFAQGYIKSPATASFQLLAKKNRRKNLDNELKEAASPRELVLREEDSEDQVDNSGIETSTRAKLKAEISSPFRKLRQFIYGAAGAAGALGTITSVPQLILALEGATEKGSVSDIALNIAIDLGAVITAVVLWDRESNAEKAKINQFQSKEQQLSAKLSSEEISEREAFLGKLPVEILFSNSDENVTRIVSLNDLQAKGKQHAIIVTGSAAFVKDALISARIEGTNLFTAKETCVIPVVYQEEQLETEGSKGFGAKDSLMNAPYIGRPTQIPVWLRYLQQEVELAERQGSKGVVDQGLVLAVAQNGKVIRRGLGLPPWKEVCDQLNSATAPKK